MLLYEGKWVFAWVIINQSGDGEVILDIQVDPNSIPMCPCKRDAVGDLNAQRRRLI